MDGMDDDTTFFCCCCFFTSPLSFTSTHSLTHSFFVCMHGIARYTAFSLSWFGLGLGLGLGCDG
jgi:hypothetical protein